TSQGCPGQDSCTSGTWTGCIGPQTCNCTVGESREIPCERCGLQEQACNSQGIWEDIGGRGNMGECEAGDERIGGACGMCGQELQRCSAACQWESPTREDQGECVAGEIEIDRAPCAACASVRTRTRSC